MTLQLINEVREDGTTRLMWVWGGDTLCNIKTHVHICKIGKRWKQTFPDVHADRMHTTAGHVRTGYYAMSRNSNCRQSVGRRQRKAASITEHSPLWVVSGSRPRQTDRGYSGPARSRSIFPYFAFILFVCLFVCCWVCALASNAARGIWIKPNFKTLELIQLDSEPSEPFNSGVPKTSLTSYVMDVSGFQPIRAGGNTHTSSGGRIITQGFKKMFCLELITE